MLWKDIVVGHKVKTKSRTLSKQEIIDFALEYDPQPMHIDEDAAKETLLGQLVASGCQTTSITTRLVVDAKPLGTIPLVGMSISAIKFIEPLLPEETIYATAEVISKRESNSKPGIGFVDLQISTFVDDRLISSQVWNAIVPIHE